MIYDGCQPAWTSTYFSHYSSERKSDGNAATRADFQISSGLECVEFMIRCWIWWILSGMEWFLIDFVLLVFEFGELKCLVQEFVSLILASVMCL